MRELLLVLALSGCGSTIAQPVGPDAQSQESALEIVWEDVYGMAVAQRPAITWLPSNDTSGEYSTPGDMRIIWTGTLISDTHFSVWLDGDREWLTFPPGQLDTSANVDRLTRAAQDALRSNNL